MSEANKLQKNSKWWGWMNRSGLIALEEFHDLEEYEEFCHSCVDCVKCSEVFEAQNRDHAKSELCKLFNFKDRMWIRSM